MDISEYDILSQLELKQINLKIRRYNLPLYFYLNKYNKYMYIKNRLLNGKNAFGEICNVKDFKPINTKSTQSFYTFGMIIKDTDNNLCFVNTVDESNNVLLKLNLNYLKQYSFFTGQLVTFKGKNLNGNELIVEKYECLYTLPFNDNVKKNDFVIEIIQNSSNILKTLSNDSVVIFLGCEISEDIKKWSYANKSNKILHVPTLDSINTINVFPQPPIYDDNIHIEKLSNPCELELNNNSIFINTLPVIDEIKENEVLKNEKCNNQIKCAQFLFKGDELDRLIAHLLFQASFCPVFPSRYNIEYDDKILEQKIHPDLYIIRSEKFPLFVRQSGPIHVINIGLGNCKINQKDGNIDVFNI